MKSHPPMRSRKSIPFPLVNLSVCLGLFLVLFLGACAGNRGKNIIWHQHYEPAEDAATLSTARDMLAEAERLMGKPALPVRKIHIRQSAIKKEPALLSRADILSWDILRHESQAKAPQKIPPAREQFEIIERLNRVIAAAASLERGRKILEMRFPGAILPMPEKIHKTEGFELCEILDAAAGSFVVYVAPARNDPMFFFKLGHEICHMTNPYVYDWHIEGLCHYFAEHMGRVKDVDTGFFQRTLSKRQDREPYSASYLMIRDLARQTGDSVWRLFDFAAPWEPGGKGEDGKKMFIDIRSWLQTLEPEKRDPAARTIRRWAGPLKRIGMTNRFVVP
ncbi:hypothetical protein EPICR_90031 [Candidatus Desulfarcum epimagneticum]|uniref:Uncharacterized protein n=1 Tax=uncultured Desulfobacteraceae bacterium TaxID=218296 RepID=A0A484HLX7_9BACT|nr:hypothetical protein EPICR_90031 [uncultured Desulfobacteraceae bacterium]